MAGEVWPTTAPARMAGMRLSECSANPVFGRLAGYEDVNDAERLRHDPAMRWIAGGKATDRSAASPSQMGRFEASGRKEPLGSRQSFRRMDRPRSCAPPAARRRARYGFERQPDAWRAGKQRLEGPPLFVFNQFGDLERCMLRPGNVHSADGWENVLKPVVARYRGKVLRR